ncbi:MAG: hypothetical protein M3520_08065 [Actinomycetota bacterium]|nr:hypothetical protein [Actinomycetota bacterium]
MQQRRPVMTPSAQVAAMVLVTGSLLSLAAQAGPSLVAVAVGLCGLLLAWGWAGILGLPTPRGTAGVLALGAVVVVLSVAVRGEQPWLTWLPAALSVSMIAALVHQLLRRDGRPRLVESVTSVVLGLALVSCGALLVPLVHTEPGAWLVAVTMAAAGASSVTEVAGRWSGVRPWLVPAALLAGGLAAVAVGLAGGLPWPAVLLLGVGAAAVSHAVRMVLSVQPTMAQARPRLVAAVSSALVTGAVAYAVARTMLPDILAG